MLTPNGLSTCNSVTKKRFNLLRTLGNYQPLTGILGLATIVPLLLLLLPSIVRAQTYTNSIDITEGGTYSGSWESWNPEDPAVMIDTTEPVTLDGCNIRGNADLIFAQEGANVTVKNCKGYGYFSNIAGQPKGHFFKSWQAKHVNIHNNYLEGTAGIKVIGYTGNRSTDQVMIRFNIAKNIDGKVALGSNGQPSYERVTDAAKFAQFVQLNGVQNVPNVKISWNQVINEPWQSHTEDVISIYNSSGTSTSPIRIAANYIKGSYAARPENQEFTGGGIMCGDGEAGNPANASAYIDCDWNQVVNASNYGMAIAQGHDIIMRNNRIVSSGLIGDTRIYQSWVGAYIWNYYEDENTEEVEVPWYNNGAQNNYIGGTFNNTGGGVIERKDWIFDDADESLTYGNIHWEAEGGAITSAMEDEEWNVWQSKLSTHGIQIGPLP